MEENELKEIWQQFAHNPDGTPKMSFEDFVIGTALIDAIGTRLQAGEDIADIFKVEM